LPYFLCRRVRGPTIARGPLVKNYLWLKFRVFFGRVDVTVRQS